MLWIKFNINEESQEDPGGKYGCVGETRWRRNGLYTWWIPVSRIYFCLKHIHYIYFPYGLLLFYLLNNYILKHPFNNLLFSPAFFYVFHVFIIQAIHTLWPHRVSVCNCECLCVWLSLYSLESHCLSSHSFAPFSRYQMSFLSSVPVC